jgi:hypothetical protein
MPFIFTISKRHKLTAAIALVASAVLGVGYWYVSRPNTPGERFDAYIERMTAFCKTYRPSPGDVTCDFLKLKPYDPVATPEGRFAHSIIIPNPVPADSGYRRGMTSKEYFEHLCRTEAGNFVFKTVSDVDGITQLRKREEATDRELSHLYAMEDPYGYTDAEAIRPHSIFVKKNRYSYFDFLKDQYSTDELVHFDRYSLKEDAPRREFTVETRLGKASRYAYTWRGIQRPHDREMGIAGGELIVLDLETGDVLGVRRGFIRSGGVREAGGIWWLGGVVCPVYNLRGRSKDFDFLYWFVGRVLRSKEWQLSFEELDGVK